MEDDEKSGSAHIIKTYLVDEDKYRFGNTQIFFRAGQVAYLEQLRTEIRRKYIVTVQSMVRCFIYHHKFQRLKRVALSIQRHGRGYLARKKAQDIRKNRAAIVIQKSVRGWLCRHRFGRIQRSILLLQTHARGLLAREKFAVTLNNHKATAIQRYCRGFLARRVFEERRRRIVICQAAVRRFLARRLFKRMKAEARTISHIQKMYKGLENKIISLQQRIDELNKINGHLKQKTNEIPELKEKLMKTKSYESDLKSVRALVADKERNIEELIKQFEAERDEKMLILDERANAENEWAKKKQELVVENEALLTSIKNLQTQDSEPTGKLIGINYKFCMWMVTGLRYPTIPHEYLLCS